MTDSISSSKLGPQPAVLSAGQPPLRTHDLIILGGGLAGLTLALQLRQRLPTLDILVLEPATRWVNRLSRSARITLKMCWG
jgi:NADPH-dependent 2,4-dienoyl-CoA reductase/sulfur reductase-like enzyme